MKMNIELAPCFYKEEDRTIRVSAQTKKIWAVLLDLLCKFDRVCKENNIRYFIDSGTLLGAARHGGFIPWDDDVDVIMLRSEYEKLNRIAKDAFKVPYFWQTIHTDPDHGRGFARLRNSETTCLLRTELKEGRPFFRHNQGVFMDVFVCDNIPDDLSERERFLCSVSALRDKAWDIRMRRIRPVTLGLMFRQHEFLLKTRDWFVETLFGYDWQLSLMKQFELACQRYNDSSTKYVSHITFEPHPHSRSCFAVPRSVYEERIELSFEGHKFPAPRRYEDYLTLVYGDWHRHVVGAPSGLIFDVEQSYRCLIRQEGLK